MKVEYALQYAAAADLAQLASLALNASLPPGFQAPVGETSTEPVSEPGVAQDGPAKWRMRAERRIVQQIDPLQVTQLVQGRGAWNVEAALKENLPLAAAPEVRLPPTWWPWMPIVPFRITVMAD